jgi:DNA-binding CsgD family transcriptional regulator
MTTSDATALGSLLARSSLADTVLESVLGALPVPAFAADVPGSFVWQNDASRAMVGDLLGVHYSQTIPSEELERTREIWTSVALGGESRRLTGIYQTPDGQPVRLEVIIAPMRREGEIVGVFGLVIPLDEDAEQGPPRKDLSSRQLEVLQLLVAGKSTRQIAEELHIAPVTVRNYVAGLLKALGARTRLEAVLIALREGVVSLDLDQRN